MEAISAVVASVVGQRDRGGDGGHGERKGKPAAMRASKTAVATATAAEAKATAADAVLHERTKLT